MDAKDIRNLQEAYLEVYNELDEGAAQRVAARAQKLANQRKGQTPERKATYQSLANKADERANPKPEADWRTGISDSTRKWNVSTYADPDKVKIKTTNPKKLRKQKAIGELKDSYDYYDIILSHLLDEGYADTQQAAEVIMVNMSEEWRESIMIDEGFRRYPKKRVGKKIDSMYDDPNIDTVFGNDARRRSEMLRVYKDMENETHPLIRVHSPKKSKAASAANRNRPESEKRSKTVSDNSPKKSFPNRLIRSDGQGITDSYDYYDIILSHLLDEGYADTQQAAEVIMVNMSEDWREVIVEAIEGLRPASERMARGVLTSAQRASQKARARREEKKKEELEKAANAILNQIGGASRRSSAPMGSTPAPQKAEAPEANRRIKPRMKSDDLASAADKVLRSLR